MLESASSNSPAPKRPFALVALAGLLLVKAVLMVLLMLGVALAISPGSGVILDADTDATVRAARPLAVLLPVLAVLLVLSAIGLLARRRSGWLLAMVLTGVFLAVDIYSFSVGTASYVWMILNIVTVFYLNQRDARAAVGAGDVDDAPKAAA